MARFEQRVAALESRDRPRLQGAELLAEKWAQLARQHPVLLQRVNASAAWRAKERTDGNA